MKRTSPHVLIVACIVGLLLGPSFATAFAQTPEASPVAEAAASTAGGINIADMDLTVDPGDDFYQFAAGGWMSRTPVPPSGWGQPFDPTSEALNDQIITIIEGIEPDPTTDLGKMRILYDQVIDTETRNAQGVAPVQPILDDILAIDSIESGLAFHQTAYATYTFFGPFDPWVDPSPVDSATNIAWLYGPWLPLDAFMLLDDSEEGQATLDAWVDATSRILVEMGFTEADALASANGALAWYVSLAGIVTPYDQLWFDPNVVNNPRTVADLEALVPGFDWSSFLTSIGWQDQTTINLQDIAYFEALGEVLASADPLALRDAYLAEMIWSGWSLMLTTDIEEIAHSFDPGYLYGVTEMDPIELRAKWFVGELLPDALGQAYVAEYFNEETRAQAQDVVDTIVEAFKVEFQQNTWLSDEGRANALERLETINIAIGYSGDWDTYEGIVAGDSLAETGLSGYLNRNAANLVLVGTPVDAIFPHDYPVSDTWRWLDQDKNAFMFSAAYLQSPHFDPSADLAMIYGSFGGEVAQVIAGTLQIEDVVYADDGTRISWYTEDDAAAYQALKAQVADRLGALTAYGFPLNVDLQSTAMTWTIGGAPVAYNALLTALAAGGQEQTPWFLTQEQRFFVAWAARQTAVLGPEAQEWAASMNFWGAPPVLAVEPLRHIDAFFESFDIQPGDAEYLAPEDRIAIW